MVAFTGVSGSGKTSLAIDTIHAEAQLRYLEGMAPFVRQFITPKDRPRVNRIDGLVATLAVDQRKLNHSSQSTLATITTIDDYLGLVFSRLPPLAPDWDPALGLRLTAAQFRRFTPEGACPTCLGIGGAGHSDPELIITRPDLPLTAGGAPWFSGRYSAEQSALPSLARHFGIDLEQPWQELPEKFRHAVLYGTGDQPIDIEVNTTLKKSGTAINVKHSQPLRGVLADVERLYQAAAGGPGRDRYAPFIRWEPCPVCGGTGLGLVGRTVILGGLRYAEIMDLDVSAAREWTDRLTDELTGTQREVATELLPVLHERLRLLGRLGLGHVQLSRTAPTLSGGEMQRARIAAQLSTALTGIAFVLDEPSAGLHPADKQELHLVLHELKERGNTVLLVEHDPDLMRHADWIIDLGPGAGTEGGRLIAQGTPEQVAAVPESLTAAYLNGLGPRVNRQRRVPVADRWLTFRDIAVHNVRIEELRIPLGTLTAITGVSGSGKSSLLNEAVAIALTGGDGAAVGSAAGLERVAWTTVVDQDPIGRTPRSNPATYTKAFDTIRKLFAATPQATAAGLKATAFSFNSPGGRCEACTGYGRRQVDMQFLPDMWVVCEVCEGRRFQPEVLAVTYRGLAIDQVLELTVDNAVEFFSGAPKLVGILRALDQVGLGYLQLGQSATELSGGEAQRMKLATAILRGTTEGGGVVILDEPATGLHPADVQRIVDAFEALLAAGNTVIVAEHDLHLAAAVDWLLDIGPGAGPDGGRLINQGPPEIVAEGSGPTSTYLRTLLS
ncbi:ABC transporter [Nocardia sp. NPDC020380]|uniref:ABC transporter n=1 Tax=Nocardia sp. NPDC020380 TaxID=3364309 RepID=UPI0037BA7455